MTAARNFLRRELQPGPGDFVTSDDSRHRLPTQEEWLKSLYHGGDVVDVDKAKTSCYNTLIDVMKAMVSEEGENVGLGCINAVALPEYPKLLKDMVDLSLQLTRTDWYGHPISGDEQFYTLLFDYLKGNFSTLFLNLGGQNIDHVIEFVKRRGDNDLLYRYYTHHGLHEKAMDLMEGLAGSRDQVMVEERVSCLEKAIQSAIEAQNTGFSKAVDDKLKWCKYKRNIFQYKKDLHDELRKLEGGKCISRLCCSLKSVFAPYVSSTNLSPFFALTH